MEANYYYLAKKRADSTFPNDSIHNFWDFIGKSNYGLGKLQIAFMGHLLVADDVFIQQSSRESGELHSSVSANLLVVATTYISCRATMASGVGGGALPFDKTGAGTRTIISKVSAVTPPTQKSLLFVQTFAFERMPD
jgi:hypothetical protein